jgi:NTP pyrophosphatase (non-canonical NTP hydrolase)
MNSIVIDYYNIRFGENLSASFIHLVREIGEIALALEKNNIEHVKLKITESVALLHFLASKYGLDVESNIQLLYAHKLDTLNKSQNLSGDSETAASNIEKQ